jgi:hypothetical protein
MIPNMDFIIAKIEKRLGKQTPLLRGSVTGREHEETCEDEETSVSCW